MRRSTEIRVYDGDVESLSSAESQGVGRVTLDHVRGLIDEKIGRPLGLDADGPLALQVSRIGVGAGHDAYGTVVPLPRPSAGSPAVPHLAAGRSGRGRRSASPRTPSLAWRRWWWSIRSSRPHPPARRRQDRRSSAFHPWSAWPREGRWRPAPEYAAPFRAAEPSPLVALPAGAAVPGACEAVFAGGRRQPSRNALRSGES